ncbi:MAG: amidase [Alphaproteobacteria bacterium]|nr:amidase [Alphaproteobacteria bacterium]
MANSDLAYMGLLELGAAIKARKVSSVEATRTMFDRIAAFDAKLYSYCALMRETAEAEAKQADAEIGKGQHKGPLHGVPVAVKDLCDAKGVVTAAGMPRIKNKNVATKDSTVVTKFRAAGAVILGKLQLTEGAVAHHHPDIKVPVNPHNAKFWSGASSSGSGVATAAGLCYGSLGSDTGGSIRLPCFANGVTGIKGSWGRVSKAGVAALSWSLDHVGPMARSAADCGAILGTIAGVDPADPTALRVPVPDYLAGLGQDLKGVRIGFDEAYATKHVIPAITKSMVQAVEVLRAAGAEIKPIKFPSTDEVLEAWFSICPPECAAAHEATFPARAADYGPGLKEMAENGHKTSGIAYAKAHNVRMIFRGQYDAVFDDVDVVVAPSGMSYTLSVKEFDVFGSKDTDWPDLIRFTAPFDMAGTPTLSLPAGFDSEGVPFGFQLLGRHLGETPLVRVGDAYQRATDHHKRRPQLAP